MPQVWATVPPGCRTSRSSPVTKAFGGQVIGSTATALRRRPGLSGSPVNTCSQGVASAGPQASPGAVCGKMRPGAAVVVAGQAGERVIKPGRADRARLPEVVGRSLDRRGGTGRHAAVVHGQPARRGQGQLALVHRRRPDGQVRVRAGAVRGSAAAAVARGDGNVQPGAWIEALTTIGGLRRAASCPDDRCVTGQTAEVGFHG